MTSGTGVSGTAVGTGVAVGSDTGVLVAEDGTSVMPGVGVTSTMQVQVSP